MATGERPGFDLVAQALVDSGSLHFSDFQFDAPPIYIDLNNLHSFPTPERIIVTALTEVVDEESPSTSIASFSRPVHPLAYDISNRLQRFPIRLEPGLNIDDGLSGNSATVITGFISGGRSVLAAVERLQHAGISVYDVVAIIERDEGSRKLLASHGLTLRSLGTIDQLIDFCARSEVFDMSETRMFQQLMQARTTSILP